MDSLTDHIRNNYHRVLGEIQAAQRKSNLASEQVKLVVVTKGQSPETIRAAYDAGARLFGENYPEETERKLEEIGSLPGAEWHMIGHLQSRKARIIAKSFNMIHSVDSLDLARKLDFQLAQIQRKMPVLLEVNVGGEASKFGYNAVDEADWGELLAEFEQIDQLPNLQVRGLMTMPPIYDDAELARPHFKRMRALREFLQKNLPLMAWDELSMGTSSDYPVAVEEGATYIRVGTAIVGPRPPK